MKISPVINAANSVSAQGVPELRSIKMDVNRTPGREIVEQAQVEQAPPAQTQPDNQIKSQEEAAPEETKPLSPQFAALAKQRRALQQEREAFEKEKATRAQIASVDLAKLKSDPLTVLGEAGVTYQQLTDAILANPVNPEMDRLKQQIKSLEEGVDKKFNDRETQAEQQVLAEMRREAHALAATGEAFELVRETKSIPHVMTLIERTYRESGEVLDVAEAMQLVEDELVKDAEKLAALKKVQSRLNPSQPQGQTPPQQKQMRTLTNRDTATQTPMSRKARALAAFYGTLKK